MTLTEQEIFRQSASLKKTYEYVCGKSDAIGAWLGRQNARQWVFTGCGSSYSLCRSAEAAFRLRGIQSVCSIPSGDLLMNFPAYDKVMDGALLVVLSRSGSTSEAIQAVRLARQRGAAVLSIIACTGSVLAELSGLALEIPWAFDDSVCQTQTVSNLYLASLLLCGIAAGDGALLDEAKAAAEGQEDFLEQWRKPMQVLAKSGWSRAVVLADADLCGAAEEGALAFNEICRVPSNYYHTLDVRHGPMVLINSNTLVAVLAARGGALLDGLLSDLKAKGALVLLACTQPTNVGVDVYVPLNGNAAAPMGLPFLSLVQMLCLYRAMQMGVDPDHPEGLDPWINLEA